MFFNDISLTKSPYTAHTGTGKGQREQTLVTDPDGPTGEEVAGREPARAGAVRSGPTLTSHFSNNEGRDRIRGEGQSTLAFIQGEKFFRNSKEIKNNNKQTKKQEHLRDALAEEEKASFLSS